jgi:hypothetical protein
MNQPGDVALVDVKRKVWRPESVLRRGQMKLAIFAMQKHQPTGAKPLVLRFDLGERLGSAFRQRNLERRPQTEPLHRGLSLGRRRQSRKDEKFSKDKKTSNAQAIRKDAAWTTT